MDDCTKNDLEVVIRLYNTKLLITTLCKKIQIAANKGHLNVIIWLHKCGADLTADDNYAIQIAAGNGHLDVVIWLHKHGADLTARNNYAIQRAAYYGHSKVVQYLLENGATTEQNAIYMPKINALIKLYTDIEHA